MLFPVVLALVGLLAGCSSDSRTPEEGTGPASAFRNVDADVAFVGNDACFSCHEEQYLGYQEHGMANSYFLMSADNVVEDFPSPVLSDPKGGYTYRAFREGDRFFQEELLRSSDGAVINRLVREMKSVMGSGTAARTYFDDSKGFLHELPLTWYTQERKWDFSPGYRVGNKRFDRIVPERCMACHNAYPEAASQAGGKYLQVPQGISCERCHGPGALHVSERLAVSDPAGDIDSTIVNPAHLDLSQRLDVCQQCHLHTTVSLLREGKGPFDFRPSHSLDEYVALFATTEPVTDDEISVISHADRMKQSACFIETVSAGGSLECTTCHNPHAGFRSQGPAYFNATCLTCHAPAELAQLPNHSSETNCISCHMPRVESNEAPHSSFTDHRVRVVTSRTVSGELGANSVATSAEGQVLAPYFASDQGPEGEPYRGMALVVLGRQKGDPVLLRQGAGILDQVAASGMLQGEGQFIRGIARLELGEAVLAREALEASVQSDPNIPERLNALAQALEASRGDAARIEELYTRAIEIQPARADIWVNFGRFLESLGRTEEAVEAYRSATLERPWLATGFYNLGTALARLGELSEGERALREATNLDPKDPQVWGNLGAIYGQQGDVEAAGQAFERAVAMAPEDAVAVGNLGAFYLNQNRFREAITYLDRAVQANPNFADGLANRALAHLRLDERASARLYARRALDLVPNHPLATQILAAAN